MLDYPIKSKTEQQTNQTHGDKDKHTFSIYVLHLAKHMTIKLKNRKMSNVQTISKRPLSVTIILDHSRNPPFRFSSAKHSHYQTNAHS